MKRVEFLNWLKVRGNAERARITRASAVARIEKVMGELGSPHQDLDVAYDYDELKQLRDALTELRTDASRGGQRFRILLPDATKPQSRITNFRSWLGQYRQFRSGELSFPARMGWKALEEMRDAFLLRVPDFRDFEEEVGLYFEVERTYKNDLLADFCRIVGEGGSDVQVGRSIYEALTPNQRPLLRWQTADAVEKQNPELSDDFYGIIGKLARSKSDLRETIQKALGDLEGLRVAGASSLTAGEILSITLTVAGFADPHFCAPFKMTKTQGLCRRLIGGPNFKSSNPIDPQQVTQWLNLLERIYKVFRDEWFWKPRDLFDVQGFAWVVLDEKWVDEEELDDQEPEGNRVTDQNQLAHAVNRILYGPPGTGKTFATAKEAVFLCDGSAPQERHAVMQRYRALMESGQIRFVTFHQSYSYEDFVEGLRPVTGKGADGLATSTGFSLMPHPGIFREICAVAEQARTRLPTSSSFEVKDRRIFKMSLGARAEDYIYDAAIKGNYVVLGWGGETDWSDPKYDEADAIRAAWQKVEDDPDKNEGGLRPFTTFRSGMSIGDIVVISDGNGSFRAVGEITGGYRYEPTGERTYNHLRAVRWLLILDESLPVESISNRQFSQGSCYELHDHAVKREALVRLLSPNARVAESGKADQFVLIIDEINRANMSKVFGELITLIEPEKRLGAGDDALTSRLPYSGAEFGVPNNLHIIATMNTADRSIALLDTALRRRFEFKELMPDPRLLEDASDRTGIDLVTFLSVINQRIEYLFDREHQIGHAYLINCETKEQVHAVMRHKVIPLLAEYFYDDWSKVAAVLGETNQKPRFLQRSELKAPADLAYDGAAPRTIWTVRASFEEAAYEGFA